MNKWLWGMGLLGALAGLPAAAQDRFAGDLCGNKVDVVMKAPAPDANPELRKFHGAWGKGKWATGICNGIVVSEVTPTSATVHYFYGTGPGVPNPGSFVKTDAVMKGKYLFFKSALGADVSYEMSGNQLTGWFGNTKLADPLQKLQ